MERTFHESARKPSQIIDKTTQKIINGQLDIKVRQITEEVIDAVLKEINWKDVGLDGIFNEVWKIKKLTIYISDYVIQFINKQQ